MKSECVISFVLTMLLFGTGCGLIDPEERIPAIVEITGVDFEAQGSPGSSQHKITEVWVYDSATLLGVYPVNTSIPFLGTKESTLFRFYPGIRNNGVLDDAIIYPLYSFYEQRLPTVAGTVSSVHPTFTYKSGVKFSLLEDFEEHNEFTVNLDTNDITSVIRSGTEAFEGSFSGEIILTADGNFIEVTHTIAMTDLPTDGSPVYLEFQYMNDVPLEVGLQGIPLTGSSFKNYFYQAKPSGTWNMLYLELTELLTLSQLPAYKIIFRAFYPVNSAIPEHTIRLDNIKVVYRQE